MLCRLESDYTLKEYTQYHDCGKPACKEVDANGRVHFPNHAEISANTYRLNMFMPCKTVEKLIRMDMVVHKMKADEIAEFAKVPEAVSLLFTALAEVHANSELFGGIDSTSFKIKWKHINKRGCALLKSFEV